MAWSPWLEVRDGLRALARAPRHAVWIVGSLAVGMAATTAAFALLNALLFRPFPGVGGQDRLVRVTLAGPCAEAGCEAARALERDEPALHAALPALASVAAYRAGLVSAGVPEARTLRAAFVSRGYFDVLDAAPAFGSGLGGDPSAGVVLADRTWREAFGGAADVLARSIRIGDRLLPIAGVAPAHFAGIDLRPARGDRGPDLWIPLTWAERPPGAGDSYELPLVGRLADGVDRAVVRAQAEALAQRLSGAAATGASRPQVEVIPVSIGNPRHRALTVAVVLPIPLLVLVIACVNAAHVLLARGAERQRELAVRLALGAGRARLVRELLVESLALANGAGVLAVPLAWWGLRLADSPIGLPLPIDAAVLASSLAVAVATTLMFGVGPALRVSDLRPSRTLGIMGAWDQASPGRSRIRRMLLVGQVALSIALMGTAWQLVSTVRGQAVSSGTPPDRLLVARFDLAPVLPAAAHAGFYRELLARVERLPDVERAGLAGATAVWTFGQRSGSRLQVWEDGAAAADGRAVSGGYATPALFEAAGMRLLAGRGFSETDSVGGAAVAVISDTAARRLGTGLGTRAIGRTLRVAAPDGTLAEARPVRVVGVVSSVAEPRLDRGEEPPPRIYLPAALQPEPALTLYARTRGDAGRLAQPLRDLVGGLAPAVPIAELGTLAELNARAYAPQLWLARTAAGLGFVGLALAAAGLYGVSAHAVTTRRRELAVRMAIGASPRAILRLVLGETTRVAAIGFAAGGAAAVLASRAIQAGWHGIQHLDPLALGGAALVYAAAMLAASLAPAWRASRLDPVETLKG